MTNTATVETLTAEVRVLMVGNRQITLSVYRQLDEVPMRYIQAFGRVQPGKMPGQSVLGAEYYTYVVGRGVSGALVRSTYDRLADYSRLPIAKQIAESWAELPLIVLAGLR